MICQFGGSEARLKRNSYGQKLLPRLIVSTLLLAIIHITPLIMSAGSSLKVDPFEEKLRTLNAAKVLWKSHNITHYRIRVMVLYSDKGDFELEVHNGQTISRNYPSKSTEYTVTGLFAQIEEAIRHPLFYNSNGSGEPCNALIVLPKYDSVLGYPRRIEYEQAWITPETVGVDLYKQAHPFGEPSWNMCTQLGRWRSPIIVDSLIPLPEPELF
jgi:hypothetical protein